MIMMNRCIKKLNDKNKHEYIYNVYEHITYLFVLQCLTNRICIYLDFMIHLRNEFHFSGVHGAMNRSNNNRKIKLIAYIYIHFSVLLVEKSPMRSHLQANKESTQSGCSNSGTASTFTTSNQIGEIHVFLRQVWITSRRVTQCCSWKYEH